MMKEILAKDHFIDGLAISDILMRIKQAGPKNLNEVVRNAMELEDVLKSEQRLDGLNSSLRAFEGNNERRISNLQNN